MSEVAIGGRMVGPGRRPLVIAEVAQAHDGSLGAAHAFIDIAADAGAGAIKFQTHIAREESTREEPFRVKFSRQDKTRYEYWQRMELSGEAWAGLEAHARERGLLFLSSPFSVAAVELLDRIGMPAWKVASGEIDNDELIAAMRATGKPFLLSTGMGGWQALDAAVARLSPASDPRGLAVFQCTTKYPTPLAEVGLNLLSEIRDRYRCPVGLSDHSGKATPSIAAMALGADLIEVHICLHKSMFGPDTPASLDPAELRRLCEAADDIHAMLTHPVDKDRMADELSGTRALFTRSLALKESLPAGTRLSAQMLTGKKPGTGIPASRKAELVGRRLVRDVPFDRLLREEDLEP